MLRKDETKELRRKGKGRTEGEDKDEERKKRGTRGVNEKG